MDTLPFLFFLGLLFIVVLGSVSGRKDRRKSLSFRESRRSIPESQSWVCPSCVESVEATSDTCPWCGWTDAPAEADTSPKTPGSPGKTLQVHEMWVSDPLVHHEGVGESSEVDATDSIPEAVEAEVLSKAEEPLIAETVEEARAEAEIQGEAAPPREEGPPLAEAVQAILAQGIMGGGRDRLIKTLVGKDFSFEVTVRRVERPISMFSDPDFRNGRSVTGKIPGTDVEVAVLYPNTRNDEVDAFEPGSTYPVRGAVADWDRLRKRPIIRTVVD